MARLKTLRSKVATLRATTQTMTTHRMDWRAWYSTPEWQRLRIATFRRDGFRCCMCGRVEGNSRALVCDHIERHHGDRVVFFDAANLQTLCKPCHDSAKQRQEIAATRLW